MLKYQKAQIFSLKSYLADFQAQFDIFGQPPGFTILKKEKFTTKIGTLSTLLIISFCLLYLYSEMMDLVERQNPSVYQYDTQLIESSAIPLTIRNFTLAITISYLNTQPIKKVDQYFNIRIKNCMRQRVFNETLNKTVVQLSCKEYPTEPCNQNHMQTEMQREYLSKMQPGSIQCIQSDAWEKNPPQFQGIVQANTFQFLQIQITICQNSTSLTSCAPIEEIKSQMKSGYYSIHISDNLLQMNEPQNPINQITMLQQTSFSIDTSRSIYQTFKRITVVTDEGIIGTDYKTKEGLISNQWREATENYNDNFIINHSIYLDDKQSTYSRNYIKIQAILGKVGGFWNVAVLLFKIFITPIVLTLMNISLINKLFRFEINSNEELIIDEIREEQADKQKIGRSTLFKEPDLDYQKNLSSSVLKKTKSQINNTNREISNYLAQHKQQLKLNFIDLILVTFCFKRRIKEQIKYAKAKCQQRLDVSFIINKIYELDKLKYILFSNEQLNLFNFLPKPIIPSDLFDKNVQNKLQALESQKQYKFMLEDEKPTQLKLQQAYQSYIKIKGQREKSDIDYQLLEYLEDDLKMFFDQVSKNDINQIKDLEDQSSVTSRNNQKSIYSNRLCNIPLDVSEANYS